jgi:O-antigen/teichoic acid export membrane protein
MAMISYFGIALNVGFADIGAREVARDSESATRLAADGTAMRLLIAAGGIAVIVTIALTFHFDPVQRRVLVLASTALIPLALDTTWVFRGLSRNRTAGLTLLLAQIAYLAGVVFLVHSSGDVARVPLIQLAGDGIAALVLAGLVFAAGIPRPSLSGGVALLKQSGYITLSRVFRTLIVTFDVILLGIIAGSRDVGLYTAAYRVCMLVTTVAVATHVVFLPGISQATADRTKSSDEVLGRSLALTSAVILPICSGGIVVARPLLILLFGAEYGAATLAFQLLLTSIALLAIHGTIHNVFIGVHRTGREALLFGIGSVLNVVLNLTLIPAYGLTGAAVATVAAEAFILIASVISIERWGIHLQFTRMLNALAASAGMIGILFAVRDRVPVWISIPAGGAAYLVVFVATGGLQRLRELSPGT